MLDCSSVIIKTVKHRLDQFLFQLPSLNKETLPKFHVTSYLSFVLSLHLSKLILRFREPIILTTCERWLPRSPRPPRRMPFNLPLPTKCRMSPPLRKLPFLALRLSRRREAVLPALVEPGRERRPRRRRGGSRPTPPSSTRFSSRSIRTPGSPPRPWASWIHFPLISSTRSLWRPPSWLCTTRGPPSSPGTSRPLSVSFCPGSSPSTPCLREPRPWPSTPAPSERISSDVQNFQDIFQTVSMCI